MRKALLALVAAVMLGGQCWPEPSLPDPATRDQRPLLEAFEQAITSLQRPGRDPWATAETVVFLLNEARTRPEHRP